MYGVALLFIPSPLIPTSSDPGEMDPQTVWSFTLWNAEYRLSFDQYASLQLRKLCMVP